MPHLVFSREKAVDFEPPDRRGKALADAPLRRDHEKPVKLP
jgi:hypothetical protein